MIKAPGSERVNKSEVIRDLYFSREGYVGVKALHDILQRKGYHTITSRDVTKTLNKIKVQKVMRRPLHIAHFGHFQTTRPNELHQMDLVEVSHDKGYNYILTVIDVHTRWAAARPLKTKTMREVARALYTIYFDQNDYLDFPDVMQVDGGKEFNNTEVEAFFDEEGVAMKTIYPGDHRKQAIIERFNRTLITPIYRRQTEIELFRRQQIERERGRPPTDREENEYVLERSWKDQLPGFLHAYNHRTHRTIGVSPQEAMENPAEIRVFYERIIDRNPMLYVGMEVRVIELEDNPRDTDERWSRDTFRIIRVIFSTPYTPRFYVVANNEGVRIPRHYHFEELQVVGREFDLELHET